MVDVKTEYSSETKSIKKKVIQAMSVAKLLENWFCSTQTSETSISTEKQSVASCHGPWCMSCCNAMRIFGGCKIRPGKESWGDSENICPKWYRVWGYQNRRYWNHTGPWSVSMTTMSKQTRTSLWPGARKAALQMFKFHALPVKMSQGIAANKLWRHSDITWQFTPRGLVIAVTWCRAMHVKSANC